MTRPDTKNSVTFFLLAGAWALCSTAARADVAGFEDLGLGAGGYVSDSSFTSGGLTFVNHVDPLYGSWDGWAYSNMTDTTTAGWANQYSAVTGGGQGETPTYAVAYRGFTIEPTITAPPNTLFQSAYLTNTTYAYLSTRDGDGVGKQFSSADADWFKLTITGRNAADAVVGSIDVYLADFRPAAERFDNPVKQNYILDQWTKVDLAGLGNAVQSLSLSFASSDNDPIWGMNTPAYAALDTLTAVPASQNPLPPDVQNTAALSLTGGVRELGHVTGGGTLVVQPGTTLVADSIVQDTLIIGAGGAVVIRESGTQQASAVPEPGLLALLLGGGGAVLAARLLRTRRLVRIMRG